MINIYLGGKITGLAEKQAKRDFKKAESRLNKAGKKADVGIRIFNPCEALPFGLEWRICMKNDIKTLVDCDWLVDVGNDDGTSKGMKLEKRIARDLKIKIMGIDDAVKFLESCK